MTSSSNVRQLLARWAMPSTAGSPARVATMESASSYDEWKAAAKRKDIESGREGWKHTDESRLFDYELVRRRLDHIRDLRRKGDDIGLYFALQEGIHGNFGGMGRAPLYQRTAFGTKQLIVDYVDATVDALEHLAKEEVTAMSFDVKLDFFRRASLCFGHTALMLSGSGSMFFFHIGVLRALGAEGLLPKILSGSSGGAMVASVMGTRRPSEFGAVLTPEHFRHFIRDPGDRTPTVTLRENFMARKHEILDDLLPDLTFVEAHRLSRLSINVSVAPADLHQSSRLLNAITSPHVYVREAILASAAVPGVFPSRGVGGQE